MSRLASRGPAVLGLLILSGVLLAVPLPADPAVDREELDRLLQPEALEPPPLPAPGAPAVPPEDLALDGAEGDAVALAPTGPGLAPGEPQTLTLARGQIQTVPAADVSRVLIGNPDIADVQVASPAEVLVQARALGTTNLIVWDESGQRMWVVEVQDPGTEATEQKLQGVLAELTLPGVSIKREGEKLFLMGEVAQQDDLDQLEKMISAYEKVTNLVKIVIPPVPPEPPLPSIKLTVQLIEMTRDGTDKLGVDWADSLTFTETTFDAAPLTSDLSERIDEAFRFGSLKRSGLDPVLNMLVTQGKARILTEPKLVAASGKDATAFLGVEVPVITTTSISATAVTQNIEFKNTGVELKFTPTLLPDGESIQTKIDAKVSSIDVSVAIKVNNIVVPGFRVRQTQTEIVTKTGESVLISGLLQDEEKKKLSQVPGVGNVPVLGMLFRSTDFVRGKTELIIVVTPELTSQEDTSADRAFLVDQALASAELTSAVDNSALRYALQIQERIAKSLRYPQREKELGVSGRVKLRLHLLRDGSLRQAVVAESSGIEAFDLEARTVAESQSPYPPFPSDLPQPELSLDVPVLFRP